jgi:hypothetical protein
MKRALVLFTILALAIADTRGEMAAVHFAELAQTADVIVLARVASVREIAQNRSYASARVIETWKGVPGSKLEFLASPTWACDISDAVVGETALLFLTRDKSSRSYVIARSGLGRMPLRTIRAKRYATFWDGVILPQATATIAGPEKDAPFIRSVALGTLHELVTVALQKRPKA